MECEKTRRIICRSINLLHFRFLWGCLRLELFDLFPLSSILGTLAGVSSALILLLYLLVESVFRIFIRYHKLCSTSELIYGIYIYILLLSFRYISQPSWWLAFVYWGSFQARGRMGMFALNRVIRVGEGSSPSMDSRLIGKGRATLVLQFRLFLRYPHCYVGG